MGNRVASANPNVLCLLVLVLVLVRVCPSGAQGEDDQAAAPSDPENSGDGGAADEDLFVMGDPGAGSAAEDPELEFELGLQVDGGEVGEGNPEVVVEPGASSAFASSSEMPPTEGPRNLRVVAASQRNISLAWTMDEPLLHGALQGYRVHYLHGNFSDVITIRSSGTSYKLTGLEPFTMYEIWLEGILSGDRRTAPSEHIKANTDVDQPGAPKILNVTCYDTGAIYIEWARPEQFQKSVDYYQVFYRSLDEPIFKSFTVKANIDEIIQKFILDKLRTNRTYTVKICAETQSLSNHKQTWLGEASEQGFVHLPESGCGPVDNRLWVGGLYPDGKVPAAGPESSVAGADAGASGELSAGMIIGAVCALLFLLLAVVGFVVWRQYCKAAYYYLDEAQRGAGGGGGAGGVSGGPGGLAGRSSSLCGEGLLTNWEEEPGPDGTGGPVSVAGFTAHVTRNHADSDHGFAHEYEEIQKYCMTSLKATHDHSSHPDNKCKNRYLNIVAYDHSRVKLLPLPGQKRTTDYINANYIDGFRKRNAYIGTQGPLEDTREAFWRMVWEQNVHVLVMITNLMERGRKKCDIYWPKDDSEVYGNIEAQLEKEEMMADYTLRTIRIKHLKLKRKKCVTGERVVKQFHYTSWPDHGVPSHPLPVLTFVRKSAEANPRGSGDQDEEAAALPSLLLPPLDAAVAAAAAAAAAGEAAVVADGGPQDPDNKQDQQDGSCGGLGFLVNGSVAVCRPPSASSDGAGGPIVVHCSAGVGRTGTYIAIDAMLRQMKATGLFNVYGFLRHIRTQRNYLVQTEEQYVFIHDVLLEAIKSGNTEVPKEKVSEYVQLLQQPLPVVPPAAAASSSRRSSEPAQPAAPPMAFRERPEGASIAEEEDEEDEPLQDKDKDDLQEGDNGGTTNATTIIEAAPLSKGHFMELDLIDDNVQEAIIDDHLPAGSPQVTTTTLLLKQFQLVTEFRSSEYLSAKKPCNASKNRDPNLIPLEAHRIPLSPKPGVDGSDYINASWLNGHTKLKEFVITQHPVLRHKEDFWRMLWEHNCQTVVLLSSIHRCQAEFGCFWPQGPLEDEEFGFETFRVRFVEEGVHEGHSTFDLVVSSQNDDYELAVRIIYCPEWHCMHRLAQAFAILKLVQDWHLEYQDGPLVVVDKFGGTEAATFCALTTLCKQLDSGGSFDVYQIAKLYHVKRPGIWKSADDLLYLYTAMETLIASKQSNPVQDGAMTTSAVASATFETSVAVAASSASAALMECGGVGGGGTGASSSTLMTTVSNPNTSPASGDLLLNGGCSRTSEPAGADTTKWESKKASNGVIHSAGSSNDNSDPSSSIGGAPDGVPPVTKGHEVSEALRSKNLTVSHLEVSNGRGHRANSLLERPDPSGQEGAPGHGSNAKAMKDAESEDSIKVCEPQEDEPVLTAESVRVEAREALRDSKVGAIRGTGDQGDDEDEDDEDEEISETVALTQKSKKQLQQDAA